MRRSEGLGSTADVLGIIMKRTLSFVALVAASLVLAGCGAVSPSSGSPAADGDQSTDEVRIGYFPNFTHAPAMVGLKSGRFQEALGEDVKISTQTFDTGTTEIEALFAGSIDIGFIGPSPTVTGWEKSDGQALHVIAGSASGGASLVVRDGIDSVEDLEGATIATPSLGNTQDVAARHWLAEQGFETDLEGGGDVHVTPMDNATALQTLAAGGIDGAWAPEPWATRMIQEGGAHELIDESDLWPDHQFVTTNVIVSTSFLEQHPDVVKSFLSGLASTLDDMKADPEGAQATVIDAITKLTGSKPEADQLAEAWANVTFTVDPLANTLEKQAMHAYDVGLLDAKPDLAGLYALDPLNAMLEERGEAAVAGL